MSRTIILVLAAVLVCTGCGASEEEQVENVVRDFARASDDGDAERACSLTTEEYWADITSSCEEFIAFQTTLETDGALERIATGEYNVTIDGDAATAESKNLGIFGLRKVDGDWKLDSNQ